MCSDGSASSAPLLVPPGVALMPDDFPERLEAVRNLFDLNCEAMAVALGVDQRRSDAGPGAAGDTVAGGSGGAAGRGRNRDLQTEEE